MKKIGIVICNFNKVDKVLECIQCILENKFTDYDLYVVDNASTDGAPEAIKEKYGDKVRLIVNKENLGVRVDLIQDFVRHTKRGMNILCVLTMTRCSMKMQ